MKIHISKLDAAKRQLETAIDLFFQEDDAVSIHSLARASHEILESLGKKQGVKSVIEMGLEQSIKPEKWKEIKNKLNIPKNFTKHADKDSDGVLEFHTELPEYYLWDACRLYMLLTQERPKNILVYYLWFTIKNPDTIDVSKFPFPQLSQSILSLGSSFNRNDKQQSYLVLSSAYDTGKITNKI